MLSATTMNELVDKIIDWQDWEDNKKYLSKHNTPEFIEKELKSGWYYIPQSMLVSGSDAYNKLFTQNTKLKLY